MMFCLFFLLFGACASDGTLDAETQIAELKAIVALPRRSQHVSSVSVRVCVCGDKAEERDIEATSARHAILQRICISTV